MTIKQQIDQDIKTALLSGDKDLTTTLRGLKSAILYAEVASGEREQGLPDKDVIVVLRKEAKKRQDSADLYEKGGEFVRRDKELAEKQVIEKYLPQQLSDKELSGLVDEVIKSEGQPTPQTMGKIIGQVKQKATGLADGSRIATAVRQRME